MEGMVSRQVTHAMMKGDWCVSGCVHKERSIGWGGGMSEFISDKDAARLIGISQHRR